MDRRRDKDAKWRKSLNDPLSDHLYLAAYGDPVGFLVLTVTESGRCRRKNVARLAFAKHKQMFKTIHEDRNKDERD